MIFAKKEGEPFDIFEVSDETKYKIYQTLPYDGIEYIDFNVTKEYRIQLLKVVDVKDDFDVYISYNPDKEHVLKIMEEFSEKVLVLINKKDDEKHWFYNSVMHEMINQYKRFLKQNHINFIEEIESEKVVFILKK
ncbi:hypothetical protein OSSY52_12360 [Tepiditoga spiralis]|uniref:Uncharacterized protein n=1 Tax=Tepiditoga spiralis TaxID=2108365 RepID=A0A7G1G4Q7_9BACT|nr:hypothetical protein [Tepiditoga spiralis]BBE31095.1 hypothetical protein OSSY52_12360 [Tepiditoga spiralis]